MFCEKCGKQIPDGSASCPECNAPVKQERTAGTEPDVPVERSFSLNKAGEVLINSPASGKIASPLTTVGAEFKRLFGSVADIFKGKNKKGLIIACSLFAVWLVMMILAKKGISGFPLTILNWLTFAKGGMRTNIAGWIGGALGKTLVAGTLGVLISGGFKPVAAGAGRLFAKTNFSTGNLGYTLAGAGSALAVYQFMAGNAVFTDTMPAVAGALLGMRALGKNGGAFYRIAASITAKKAGGTRTADTAKASALLSGVSMGCALGALLSLIPFGWMPVILGAVCGVAGAVLILLGSKNGKRAAAAAAVLLITASLLSPMAVPAQAATALPNGFLDPVDALGLTEKDNHSNICSMLSGHERNGEQTKDGYKASELYLVPVSVNFYSIRSAVTILRLHAQDSTLPDVANVKEGTVVLSGLKPFTVGADPVTYSFTAEYSGSGSATYLDTAVSGNIQYKGVFDLTDIYFRIGSNYNVHIEQSGTQDLTARSTSGGSDYESHVWNDTDKSWSGGYTMWSMGADQDGPCLMCSLSFYTRTEDGASASPTTSIAFKVLGIKFVNRNGTVKSGSTSFASGEPGEVAVSIPALVVIGVLSAGAAVVGSAAGGTATAEELQSDDRRKGFSMYVSKDFGDAIRRGAKPVAVKARMVEIDDNGKETDRPDVTAEITVTATNLTVESYAMNGKYMTARVSAAKDAQAENGTVHFTLSGKNGSFKNSIIFRLVDEPKIRFIEESSYSDGGITIDDAAGSGRTHRALFTIADATEEPSKIEIKCGEGLEASWKPAQGYVTYELTVINRSEPDVSESVFAKVRTVSADIEATMPDGGKVYGSAAVNLYPEGIKVLTEPKNDMLEVISYTTKKPDSDSLDPKIRPTMIKMSFVAKDPEGVPTVMTMNTDIILDDFEPTDDHTKAVLGKYECGKSNAHKGEAGLAPESSLPEIADEYKVTLPCHAEAFGTEYTAKIPVRLLGQPFDPMKGWNEEFRKLVDTVDRYWPIETKASTLRHIRENYRDPELFSATELRMIRRDMLEFIQDYWYSEGQYQMKKSVEYTWVLTVLEAHKKAGDIAFSIVIKYYLGDMAEAWLTPLKDFAVEMIGRYLSSYIDGSQVKFMDTFAEQAFNACENLIMNELDMTNANSAVSKGDIKKVAQVMVAFLLMDVFKNYSSQPDDAKDMWSAVTTAFKNMTAQALLKVIGAKLSSMMGSDTVKKFFEGKFMTELSKALGSTAELGVEKVVEEVIGSFFGTAVGHVVENTELADPDTVGTWTLVLNLREYGFDKNITLKVNFLELCNNLTTCGAGTYIWNIFTGAGLTPAAKPVEFAADPATEQTKIYNQKL